MIDPIILIEQVAVLVLIMIPGFLLAKCNLVTDNFGKSISNVILYAAQPALIIMGFVSVDFNTDVILRMVMVFILALISHILFYLLGLVVYKNAPDKMKRVLLFATVFTNAGYMGVPLLEALFAREFPEIAIYGSVYISAFNIFCWSLGCYIYSKDKKYISVKKIILNPATISTLVGLAFFILSAFVPVREAVIVPLFRQDGLVRSFVVNMKGLVAPLSMLLIGFRFASLKLRGVFKDKYLYICIFVSLFVVPLIAFLLTKMVSWLGIYTDALALSVILVSTAAPAATATGMFAEKFDGDAPYASLIVSVTSVLCVISMPIVSLLTLL